ncbi:MAG: 4Fe-4S binding protein [Spirochaetales bacterium]|nr:4Fe-4S binding protein [Spirochaetales bacterium]
MKRKIIHIDDGKCNGCGLCLPNCPEGAIQLIDGKARLVSDLFCDGLGACLGHCPEGAITVEEREAEPFDESKVMENIIPQGMNTIKAHLAHLLDHGEDAYYAQALEVLARHGIPVPAQPEASAPPRRQGCPGSLARSLNRPEASPSPDQEPQSKASALGQWPVQMHLINPGASYFRNSDLLLAADCAAFAMGNFHTDFLKGKTLAIACPKLDQKQENYLPKITALIDEAKVNSITVLIMEVPCCGGLLAMAQQALAQAQRSVPLKLIVAGIDGEVISEEWVNVG